MPLGGLLLLAGGLVLPGVGGRQADVADRVAFYGRLAEIAGQYLETGSQVYIEGSLRTRKWQDKDGQDRYTTEIRADEMKMLGSRQGAGEAPPREREAAPAPSAGGKKAPASNFSDMDDDIPF